MKICIPIKTALEGGGNNFVVNFRRYLDEQGISHTNRIGDRYDVLFTMHWVVGYDAILSGIRRNPNARIVHRIDGAAEDYGRDNRVDRVQRKISKIADLTIFQSRYCNYSTREKFSVIVQDGPIIHNPVDIEQFRPNGQRMDLPKGVRVLCATWSTNPMKGAHSIYTVARMNPDVQFILCGRYPDAPDLPNIKVLGVLDREQLSCAMRSCDALYFPSENEACPNVVLEALASGLPVLYKNSGATTELVADCGLPVEVENFRENLDVVIANKIQMSEIARARTIELFSPDVVFARYLREIKKALTKPTSMPAWRRNLIAWNPLQVLSLNGKRFGRAMKARIRRDVALRAVSR